MNDTVTTPLLFHRTPLSTTGQGRMGLAQHDSTAHTKSSSATSGFTQPLNQLSGRSPFRASVLGLKVSDPFPGLTTLLTATFLYYIGHAGIVYFFLAEALGDPSGSFNDEVWAWIHLGWAMLSLLLLGSFSFYFVRQLGSLPAIEHAKMILFYLEQCMLICFLFLPISYYIWKSLPSDSLNRIFYRMILASLNLFNFAWITGTMAWLFIFPE